MKRNYKEFNTEDKIIISKKKLILTDFLAENLKPKEFKKMDINYYFKFDYRTNDIDWDIDSETETYNMYFEKIDNKIIDVLNFYKISFNDLKKAFKELSWI